jgi:predicted nucleotidyltransferase
MSHKGRDLLLTDSDAQSVRAALTELQAVLLNMYGSQAPTLLLYGSYSRQEATSSSDVDVVLLYPGEVKPGEQINQLRAILSALNLRYQILISLLPVSAHQYNSSPTAFWKNVRREAVPLERI